MEGLLAKMMKAIIHIANMVYPTQELTGHRVHRALHSLAAHLMLPQQPREELFVDSCRCQIFSH
jgi:hypothetical protein